MIAKSDVVILLVSATILVGGIIRWQDNMASLNSVVDTSQPAPTVQNTQRSDTATPVVATTQESNVPVAREQSDPPSPASTAGNAQSTLQGDTQPAANDVNSNVNAASTTQPASSATNGSNEPLYGVYVVQSGDFLGKIATEFGTTVETLQRINGISGTLINVDQQIRYPLPAN